MSTTIKYIKSSYKIVIRIIKNCKKLYYIVKYIFSNSLPIRYIELCHI